MLSLDIGCFECMRCSALATVNDTYHSTLVLRIRHQNDVFLSASQNHPILVQTKSTAPRQPHDQTIYPMHWRLSVNGEQRIRNTRQYVSLTQRPVFFSRSNTPLPESQHMLRHLVTILPSSLSIIPQEAHPVIS